MNRIKNKFAYSRRKPVADMNQEERKTMEKRAFQNAIFATGSSETDAALYRDAILGICKKEILLSSPETAQNPYLTPLLEQNDYVYLWLVRLLSSGQCAGVYEKALEEEAYRFFKEYLVYGNHLKSLGELDDAMIHPAQTHAYQTLLHTIIGQDEMKHTLSRLGCMFLYNKKREEYCLSPLPVHKVFAFVGPPGTAKTTSALFFARMMKETNVLHGTRTVQITGSQLKAGYVGQTSQKVHEIFQKNDIIIIDEAYSLVNSNESGQTDTFSQEALAQLCAEVEEHSDDKLIIFAGYGGNVDDKNNKMKQFLDENPGIASRITFTVPFYSYTAKEMLQIFAHLAAASHYELEEGWQDAVAPFFEKRAACKNFGNGREARKLLEHAATISAERYICWAAGQTASPLYTAEEISQLTRIKKSALYEAAERCLHNESFYAGA